MHTPPLLTHDPKAVHICCWPELPLHEDFWGHMSDSTVACSAHMGS
jgi:hypothetical protein